MSHATSLMFVAPSCGHDAPAADEDEDCGSSINSRNDIPSQAPAVSLLLVMLYVMCLILDRSEYQLLPPTV